MNALPCDPSMQAVEAEIDALLQRAGSQEQASCLLNCDQSQVSRKMTRVAAGDASWIEVLRLSQGIALSRQDDRVHAAIEAAMAKRPAPRGDERALPSDIQAEVEHSAALTQTWLRATADNNLNAAELAELIHRAEDLRATCDKIITNARAQLRRPT
jgi:hypothetical protein